MSSDLTDILRARIEKAGFAPKLAVQFVMALMKVGGKFEDVERYLVDAELQLRVARHIKAAKTEDQPDYQVCVHVHYSAAPSLYSLKLVFSGGVSGVWDKRVWTRHRSLKHVAEMPGQTEFRLQRFGRKVTSDYVILWAETNGYYVATHIEGLAFALANLEVQLEREYAALGSSTMSGGSECVACFSHNGDRPIPKPVLGDSRFAGEWGPSTAFLLVCNPIREFETEASSIP